VRVHLWTLLRVRIILIIISSIFNLSLLVILCANYFNVPLNFSNIINTLLNPIKNLWVSVPIFIFVVMLFIASRYWTRKKEENQGITGGSFLARTWIDDLPFTSPSREEENVVYTLSKRITAPLSAKRITIPLKEPFDEEHRNQARELEKQPPPLGFKLRYTLSGHLDVVRSVTWSPDGLTLASGSNDRTIRLWNAQTGQVQHTLSGHLDVVRSVTWSPDGLTLVLQW